MSFKSFTSVQRARDSAKRQLGHRVEYKNLVINLNRTTQFVRSFVFCKMHPKRLYCHIVSFGKLLYRPLTPTSWRLFSPIVPLHTHNWLTLSPSISKYVTLHIRKFYVLLHNFHICFRFLLFLSLWLVWKFFSFEPLCNDTLKTTKIMIRNN